MTHDPKCPICGGSGIEPLPYKNGYRYRQCDHAYLIIGNRTLTGWPATLTFMGVVCTPLLILCAIAWLLTR